MSKYPKLGNVHKYKRDGQWQRKNGKRGYRLNYWDEHGHRHRTIVWGTKTEAEQENARKYRECLEKLQGYDKIPRERHTIQTVAAKYYEWHREKNHAPETITLYENTIDDFVALLGDIYIAEVTRPHLIQYKRHREQQEKVHSEATVSISMRNLRAFLKFAEQYDFIEKSPFFDIDVSTPDPGDIRWLSDKELERIYKVLPEMDQEVSDLFRVYLYTGARRSEILPPIFTWENIEGGVIRLYNTHTKKALKRGKPRDLEMSDAMHTLFDRRRKEHAEAPFNISPRAAYWRICKKLYEKAKIEDADIQTIRRTTGRLLLEAGWSIYDVKEWLGHASIDTTMRWYTKLVDTHRTKMGKALDEKMTTLAENTPEEK